MMRHILKALRGTTLDDILGLALLWAGVYGLLLAAPIIEGVMR